MAAARHGVQDEAEEPLSPEEQTVALLQEIRDELAKGGNGGTVLK
jgi:large-conductance mechanosensitive channel